MSTDFFLRPLLVGFLHIYCDSEKHYVESVLRIGNIERINVEKIDYVLAERRNYIIILVHYGVIPAEEIAVYFPVVEVNLELISE